MKQSSCSWSSNLIVWTILFSLLILVCVAGLILKHPGETNYIVLGAVILIIGFLPPMFLSPYKIQVTDNAIKVKMLVFSYSIPAEKVEKVEKYAFSAGTRLFGIGNFFGCVGWFKNAKLGKHLAFVTNSSQCFVIYRKDNVPVVVTADDEFIFQQFIKQ